MWQTRKKKEGAVGSAFFVLKVMLLSTVKRFDFVWRGLMATLQAKRLCGGTSLVNTTVEEA